MFWKLYSKEKRQDFTKTGVLPLNGTDVFYLVIKTLLLAFPYKSEKLGS